MRLLKGAIMGTMVGTVIGVMNSDNLSYVVRKGKKRFNKMMKKYVI